MSGWRSWLRCYWQSARGISNSAGVRSAPTLVPLFFSLGLFLFLKSRQRPKYLILSAIVFAVSMHTYYSARVIVPLFVTGLSVIFWRELWQARQQTFTSVALFLGIFLPLAFFWISPQGMARADATLSEEPLIILSNYISYFSPQFLFFEGDPNIRHSLPNFGQLHLFELVTVMAGLFVIFREKRREGWILWLWLIVYPIPAAFTESHHAVRSMVGAPLFAVISAQGLVMSFEFFRSLRLKAVLMPIAVATVLLSSLLHLKTYFVDYPKYGASAWQYGMKEAIAFTERSAHRDVAISRRLVPYIFVLFYTRFPPDVYQEFPRSLRESMWLEADRPLGKYYFPNIHSLVIPEGTGPSRLPAR